MSVLSGFDHYYHQRCPPFPVLHARRKLAQGWNIHSNFKDSTFEVICHTSSQVCLDFLDALKWVFFLSISMCIESDGAPTCTWGPWGSLSSPICSSLTFISLCSRVIPPPRGPLRNQNTSVLCTLYIAIWGGTWTVIPAENSTPFSPVKSSVRPHHGEQALKNHDIISLPGRVFIQFSPQHCTVVRSLQRGEKKKKWEIRDSAEGKIVLISVLGLI